MSRIWHAILAFTIGIAVCCVGSHGQGRRPPRSHTVNETPGKPSLIPATVVPSVASRITIVIEGEKRVVRANGIPDHNTGPFPNRGNPHSIRAQSYMLDMPAFPQLAGRTTKLGMHNFGIAVDGVPFDPGAAEWYKGIRGSQWQYELLSGAINLGLDTSYAHVQPNGAYHYHGLPILLLRKLNWTPKAHSPLVGWAADGFPIYAVYGFSDAQKLTSRIKGMRSSYRLKSGPRPSGGDNPGGTYDGTFLAYFPSTTWPVIPRCYKGTPSKSFTERRPGFGPPPGGRRGPPGRFGGRPPLPPGGRPPPGFPPPPWQQY